MFLLDLIIALALVTVILGSVVIINKWLEYQDDRTLDDKIGGWFGKQNYIFVQLFPPSDNSRSLAEMEKFFINLHSIYTAPSKKDLYVDGKWYDTFTFEFHSRGGQIGIFVRLNKNFLPLFRSSLSAHYPGTGIIECPDPIAQWPKEWDVDTGFGEYRYLYGTDIELGSGNDMFPLKSWKTFQRGNEAPITDPINVLLSSLEDIEPNDYIILQFVLTPHAPSKDLMKNWKDGLQKIKKEFANNASVETNEAGQLQVLTKQEKEIIDTVEAKINRENFKSKFRILLLSDQKAPQRLLSRVMNYFKEYQTEKQFLKPAKATKSNISDEGERFGFVGPTVGVWLDDIYWKAEQRYRQQKAYLATIKRSGSRGISPYYVDSETLAALIHFPMTGISGSNNAMLNKVTLSYEEGKNISMGGQPPLNLPV